MSWFGFGKEREIIDLSERYRKMKERKADEQPAEEQKEDSEKPVSPPVNRSSFFAGLVSNVQKQQEKDSGVPSEESAEERKKKLAKRLAEMHNKIEEMSTQIYKLQQRVEVLERKNGLSGF